MGKKADRLDSLTALEREKQSKLLAGEFAEELDATGQEDDVKAAKWVIEKGVEERHEEDEMVARLQEKLHMAQNNTNLYWDRIINEARRQMKTMDVPVGFSWGCFLTEKGWVLWFRSSEGKFYSRATKICGEPQYDMNAITRFIFGALDQMERMSEPQVGLDGMKRTKGGIVLPN